MRNLNEIENIFINRLNNIDSKDEELTILNLLNSITTKELNNFISTISQEKLLRICSLSYSHPNGFDKIVLINNHLFGLRLHIWWKSKEITKSDNDIHNHRWNFASKLLTGNYNSETYTVTKNNLDYSYFIYHHNKNNFSLEEKNKSGLELVKSETIYKSNSYSQTYNTLHRINISNIPMITLFLHGKKKVQHTDVYKKKKGFILDLNSSIKFLKPEELRDKLDKIKTILNKS